MAGAVAALEASVKSAEKPKGRSGGGGGGGVVKRSVTKHSVINRIDLNKFQSVSEGNGASLIMFLTVHCLLDQWVLCGGSVRGC